MESSIEDLKRQLKEKDDIIRELEDVIEYMKKEKDEMIDHFKISTNILIERMKHEEEKRTGIRPQTAQLLNDKRKSDMRNSRVYNNGMGKRIENATTAVRCSMIEQ